MPVHPYTLAGAHKAAYRSKLGLHPSTASKAISLPSFYMEQRIQTTRPCRAQGVRVTVPPIPQFIAPHSDPLGDGCCVQPPARATSGCAHQLFPTLVGNPAHVVPLLPSDDQESAV
eukprot:3758816-Pyramimonas_sp.AAC.1